MTSINLKGVAIQIAAASGLQYISIPRTKALTIILYHDFFFAGETKANGRERLKRQLAWIQQEYSPVTLTTAMDGFVAGKLPPNPLLITIDDVETDLLDVYDVFKSFGIPLALFVCVGWASQARNNDKTLLARIVAAIEWYRGPDFVLPLGGGRSSLHIGAASRAATIDQLLGGLDEYACDLPEIADRLRDEHLKIGNRACNWQELSELAHDGVQFGPHSVSHVPLATATRLRRAFEIRESKRLTEECLGPSSVFAYPYGMSGTFSAETTEELKKANFTFAFLTEAGFASPATDPLHLPRIALPDREISLPEFRARVKGGGIVLQNSKKLFRELRSLQMGTARH